MRRTGRTSRIVSFAVEQLLTVGECIVTDHIAYEKRHNGRSALHFFIKEVARHFHGMAHPNQELTYSDIYVDGVILLHFKVTWKTI